MPRTALKVVLVIVGGYVTLGTALILVDAIHGINDQDPSFVLWLLVLFMNKPTVWVLDALDVSIRPTPVVLAGIVQWAVIGCAVAAVWNSLKAMDRRATQSDNATVARR
jgi:hypothetical protein